jgi:hypothetical protein
MKKRTFKATYILYTIAMCLFVMQVQSQSFNQSGTVLVKDSLKIQLQHEKKGYLKAKVSNKGNHLSLYGVLSLNHQIINDNGITTPINYLYNSVNNNAFKPGYSGGFRWDGKAENLNSYTILFGINKVSAGTYYKNKYSIAPFPDEFTHFKSDNNFTTLNIAVHYKKLLPVNKMDKYKFYAIAGPSIDYKISNISTENLINGAGNRSIINADLGAEFDNKSYYILFAHYKIGTNLFNSTAPIQLNRFEVGMSIKAKDLF